jgi:hypothetical protein
MLACAASHLAKSVRKPHSEHARLVPAETQIHGRIARLQDSRQPVSFDAKSVVLMTRRNMDFGINGE